MTSLLCSFQVAFLRGGADMAPLNQKNREMALAAALLQLPERFSMRDLLEVPWEGKRWRSSNALTSALPLLSLCLSPFPLLWCCAVLWCVYITVWFLCMFCVVPQCGFINSPRHCIRPSLAFPTPATFE